MMPGTYQAVYNVSKSFVHSFAEALRIELASRRPGVQRRAGNGPKTL